MKKEEEGEAQNGDKCLGFNLMGTTLCLLILGMSSDVLHCIQSPWLQILLTILLYTDYPSSINWTVILIHSKEKTTHDKLIHLKLGRQWKSKEWAKFELEYK